MAEWKKTDQIMLQILFLAAVTPATFGGLLGAGSGAGSCPAFPYRATLLDHVAGCPRWAECCSEFGYCHSKESWVAGNFRDCNGESNGSPLPGSVIRVEALAAAEGDTLMTAAMLGISSEIWNREVQLAVTSLSSSSSSLSSQSSSSTSSSSSSQSFQGSSFAGQSQVGLAGFGNSQSQGGQTGFQASGFGSSQSQSGQTGFQASGFSSSQSQTGLAGQSQAAFSSSDLVAQIVLALQPQVEQTVQLAVQNTKKPSVSLTASGSAPAKRPRPQNALPLKVPGGGASLAVANNISAGSIDVSQIVAQVLAVITPEITRVVQQTAA